MEREAIISEFPADVRILVENGRLTGEWSNVFDHCITEARVAAVLQERLNLEPEEGRCLIRAALLHDWNKRNEREAANRDGYEAYNRQAVAGTAGLIPLGVSAKVVILIEAVGHTALVNLKHMGFVARVMHYIDDITYGDKVTSIDERMDALEAAPRYRELNESGRALLNGRTYFEVQRECAKAIEREIEEQIGEPIVPMLKRVLRIS